MVHKFFKNKNHLEINSNSFDEKNESSSQRSRWDEKQTALKKKLKDDGEIAGLIKNFQEFFNDNQEKIDELNGTLNNGLTYNDLLSLFTKNSDDTYSLNELAIFSLEGEELTKWNDLDLINFKAKINEQKKQQTLKEKLENADLKELLKFFEIWDEKVTKKSELDTALGESISYSDLIGLFDSVDWTVDENVINALSGDSLDKWDGLDLINFKAKIQEWKDESEKRTTLKETLNDANLAELLQYVESLDESIKTTLINDLDLKLGDSRTYADLIELFVDTNYQVNEIAIKALTGNNLTKWDNLDLTEFKAKIETHKKQEETITEDNGQKTENDHEDDSSSDDDQEFPNLFRRLRFRSNTLISSNLRPLTKSEKQQLKNFHKKLLILDEPKKITKKIKMNHLEWSQNDDDETIFYCDIIARYVVKTAEVLTPFRFEFFYRGNNFEFINASYKIIGNEIDEFKKSKNSFEVIAGWITISKDDILNDTEKTNINEAIKIWIKKFWNDSTRQAKLQINIEDEDDDNFKLKPLQIKFWRRFLVWEDLKNNWKEGSNTDSFNEILSQIEMNKNYEIFRPDSSVQSNNMLLSYGVTPPENVEKYSFIWKFLWNEKNATPENQAKERRLEVTIKIPTLKTLGWEWVTIKDKITVSIGWWTVNGPKVDNQPVWAATGSNQIPTNARNNVDNFHSWLSTKIKDKLQENPFTDNSENTNNQ